MWLPWKVVLSEFSDGLGVVVAKFKSGGHLPALRNALQQGGRPS